MPRTLAAALVGCLSIALVTAQEPAERSQASPPAEGSQAEPQAERPLEGPTFRTGVELLTVDVTVLDRNGNPLEGLRAPEFTVKIDGKPRRVVSAEYIGFDIEAAKRAADFPVETHFTSNIGPPVARMLLFVVDQANIRTGAARPILSTAAKYLDRLSPLDRIAFVALPPPGPAVDFTTDRFRLRQAMNLVVGAAHRFDGKFNIGESEAFAIIDRRDNVTFQRVVDRECFATGQSTAELEQCAQEVEVEASQMVLFQRERALTSLSALRTLLTGMLFIDGQKSLIFISEGLQLDQASSELEEIARIAALASVSINIVLLDVPRFDASQVVMSPTVDDDRVLQTQGLEALAGQSRGALYRVTGNGESVFDRLVAELSGYYLLGVEQEPGDRDGKRHRIDVEVGRRGVILRSRRAFVLPETPANARKPEDILTNALRSPMAIPELPLRVTTFSQPEIGGDGKVRIILAAEVGQAGAPQSEFTVGFVLLDGENKVVASNMERKALAPADDGPDAPLVYSIAAVVDPGKYSLRLGAIDTEGRRGTVVRPLDAWHIVGEDFAVGDLVIGNAPGANERLLPSVEARVRDGRLGAYLELYGANADVFGQANVTLQIAEDEISAPITTVPTQVIEGPNPFVRIAAAIVPTRALPPGKYVVRAHVTRQGKAAGLLTRPFLVIAPDATTARRMDYVASTAMVLDNLPKFEAATVLTPDMVDTMLDAAERTNPSLKKIMADARAGNLRGAAVQALEAGDQATASFLNGLDLLKKGDAAQAIRHLDVAAGPRRTYFPAAFYLGASYASMGRDRDAAGVWQLAGGTPLRPALYYVLLADARLREGQGAAVVELLKTARTSYPEDDEITKRLAFALVMSRNHAEALPVLHEYLARHPKDQDALLAAIVSIYETAAAGALTNADRTKMPAYAAAYEGPQKALVSKYVQTVQP